MNNDAIQNTKSTKITECRSNYIKCELYKGMLRY